MHLKMVVLRGVRGRLTSVASHGHVTDGAGGKIMWEVLCDVMFCGNSSFLRTNKFSLRGVLARPPEHQTIPNKQNPGNHKQIKAPYDKIVEDH